jgi:phosphoribosylpyrophosphate synthetase
METGLTILAGSASTRLGAEVCELLAVAPVACESRRFPDGELQVELGQSVRGRCCRRSDWPESSLATAWR